MGGADLGHGAVFVAADVTKKADCAKLVETVVARFGPFEPPPVVWTAGVAHDSS